MGHRQKKDRGRRRRERATMRACRLMAEALLPQLAREPFDWSSYYSVRTTGDEFLKPFRPPCPVYGRADMASTTPDSALTGFVEK